MSDLHIPPGILENSHVRMEPFAAAHREGLRAAAEGDPALFSYMPMDLSGPGFDPWMDWTLGRSDGRRELAFAVRRKADDRIVGSTRFLNIALEHKRAEIGYTWYSREAWSSKVNPSCKLLLMDFAFRELGFNRIELKTDARNLRSRAAILRLGAREEGIFRQHMIMPDGYIRDSVYFSIVRDEWSQVGAELMHRLAQ